MNSTGLDGLRVYFGDTYILTLLVMVVVGVFGILGNFVCAVILLRKRMRSVPLNLILAVLTVWDILTIIGITGTAVGYHSVAFLITGNHAMITYWFTVHLRYTYPMALTGQHGSNAFTVLAALERCIYVCHPLKSRIWITRSRTVVAMVLTASFILLYNIPFWFQIVVEYDEEGGVSMSEHYLTKTILWTIFYGPYTEFVIGRVIPFVILAVGSSFLLRGLWRARKQRNELTRGPHMNRGERHLTHLTLAVVTLSLMPTTLQIIWIVLVAEFGKEGFQFEETPAGIVNIFQMLMIVVNSSVNFVIYCVFGKGFREEVVGMFSFTRRTR